MTAQTVPPTPATTTSTVGDTTLRDVCGRVHRTVCLGPMTKIPRVKAAIFRDAGERAVDIVMGDELPARLGWALARFERVASGSEPRHGRPLPSEFLRAWHGTSAVARADSMMRGLRGTLRGQGLTTRVNCSAYRNGGTRGWDGGDGPPAVNVCPQIPLTPWYIAGTIVHETAHRAGFHHPRYNRKAYDVGRCEPPYVVGSLVRSIAEPRRIDVNTNHCAYLQTVAVELLPSPVSVGSTTNVEVFLLSTPTLDARRLTSLTLGNGIGREATAVARSAKVVDHNGDGRKDLRVLFGTSALRANGDLSTGTTQLTVRAAGRNKLLVEGTAAVTVVP